VGVDVMSLGMPITNGWYKIRARYFYFKRMKEAGFKIQEIAETNNLSRQRVNDLILKCNRYKKQPYKETRDIYAEFKKHYDEVMK